MKKSELQNYIRENIISTLSEDTEAEIAATKELTSAVKDLEAAKKEAGIEEVNILESDYDQIIGSIAIGISKLQNYVNSTSDDEAKELFSQFDSAWSNLDNYMAYGSMNEEMLDINEMAKISGDLKSSIEKVINDNKDLEKLPLKKKIKADADVISALGDGTLHDNQLNKFIAVTKGEVEVSKRSKKSNSSTSKKSKSPNPAKKDSSLSTSTLGGKKYYSKKGEDTEGPSDGELRKLAKSGGNMSKQIQQQEKSKLIKTFLKDMKDNNIVDSANRVVDKEKYDAAWSKAKPEIELKVKSIS